MCMYVYVLLVNPKYDPSIFRVRYALAFRSMVNLIRTPRFGAVMLLTYWDGKERERVSDTFPLTLGF